jgi:hypothetical protein
MLRACLASPFALSLVFIRHICRQPIVTSIRFRRQAGRCWAYPAAGWARVVG